MSTYFAIAGLRGKNAKWKNTIRFIISNGYIPFNRRDNKLLMIFTKGKTERMYFGDISLGDNSYGIVTIEEDKKEPLLDVAMVNISRKHKTSVLPNTVFSLAFALSQQYKELLCYNSDDEMLTYTSGLMTAFFSAKMGMKLHKDYFAYMVQNIDILYNCASIIIDSDEQLKRSITPREQFALALMLRAVYLRTMGIPNKRLEIDAPINIRGYEEQLEIGERAYQIYNKAIDGYTIGRVEYIELKNEMKRFMNMTR